MPAIIAVIEDCAPFICTSQLSGRVAHRLGSALSTLDVDHGALLDVLVRKRLHCRSLLAKRGWESGRFRAGDGVGGCSVLVAGAADAADENGFLVADGAVEEVAAVGAENDGAIGCHGGDSWCDWLAEVTVK